MTSASEKVITTTCNSHCGGACVLKVHVRDGVITRIETDDGDEPQFRACLKGRAYRQRVYASDRLLHPLKRVGERGEGKFQRISWDEALNTVAHELKRVRDTHGPASILYFCSAGDIHTLHNQPIINRLLNMMGGYTGPWGFISYEGGCFSAATTYGTLTTAHTRDDLLNSRLILMWGWDPANTRLSTGTDYYLARAKEKGIKIISVDPRYTDSTAAFAQQWIPIRPGTDAAMLIAMAYVIISENLQHQAYLDRYTYGFDRFKDYVLGVTDDMPKTPAWAEAITGVPAATIASLAREYATTKPACLMAGIAPGRTAYGEQYHRAAITLSAMTGNIGVSGGSSADRGWGGEYWGGELPFMVRTGGKMKATRNQVEAAAPLRQNATVARGAGTASAARVNVARFADAILEGKAGGFPADYKLLYLVNANYLNQIPDVTKTVRAFKALEFFVVQEQFMTPTARYADIILPTCTFLERNDFTSGGSTPFFGLANQAIEPLGECRSHLEIGIGLAQRLGLDDFNDKTEEEWLAGIVAGYGEAFGVPNYDTLKQTGVYKAEAKQPYVAFREQIEQGRSFPTPSGKIEIFSQAIAAMADPSIPPIPTYVETWESRNDPLAQQYPLQLITTHFKRRAHSQFETMPWLRELQTQALSMNPSDAQPRSIQDGDLVRVFNQRGQVVLPARLTERIMPGVVDMPQGAWYAPDQNGIDRGGCANVLTSNRHSPGGAFPSNTCLVEVERAE